MNNMLGKVQRPKLNPLTLALLGVWLAPAAALADPLFQVALNEDVDMERFGENSVEIGIGYSNTDSFKFGEYTGITEEGAFGIANINWRERSTSQDSRYWSITGSNLGLPSRTLELGVGDQGNYSLTFGFDQLTRSESDSTSFIFDGLGGTNLTLPSGWPGIGQPPTAAATITAAEKPYDIKQERTGYNLGISKLLGEKWDLVARFRQEDREGDKLIGAVIGNSGGNPRAVIIPRPVDDSTRQFEALARFTTMETQFQLGYYFSQYSPNNESLVWQNPYNAITGWDTDAGFPTGQGQLALDPANSFHKINLTGAQKLSNTARLTGTLSFGRMLQDDNFLPYTVNPALTVTTPVPRSSLDGQIDNTLLDLGLVLRPVRALHMKASYRYEDRDNQTPQAQYLYIGGDSMNQPATPVNASQARTNLPVSSTQNLFKFDAEYELVRHTKLRGQYTYNNIERTYEARDETTDNAALVELRRSYSETFTGALQYEYSTRVGSDYDGSKPFYASYDPTYAAANLWDTLPSLRKSHLADRNRHKAKVLANLVPGATTSVQFAADYYVDDYHASEHGLTEADGLHAGVDGSWAPTDELSGYAFYSFDKSTSLQENRSFSGGANKYIQSADPTRDWSADLGDASHTVGLGVKYAFSPELKLGIQYVHSQSSAETSVYTGPGLTPPATAVPDITSDLDSVQLYGSYLLTKQLSLRANYWYERYRSADWAYDNAGPASSNNVILTGQTSPDYAAHVVGLSVAYKSW